MSGEERRVVILDAAHREFARAGYHGASTARIAAAAECSEPMLYKHFAGKQDLFTAVLIDSSHKLDALMDERVLQAGDNLVDQVALGMAAVFQNPIYADTMRMRILAMTVIDLPGVRETLMQLNAEMTHRTHIAFERGVSEGNAVDPADVDYITWMWMGIQFAACYRDAIRPGSFAEMLPHAERFLDRYLAAE